VRGLVGVAPFVSLLADERGWLLALVKVADIRGSRVLSLFQVTHSERRLLKLLLMQLRIIDVFKFLMVDHTLISHDDILLESQWEVREMLDITI